MQVITYPGAELNNSAVLVDNPPDRNASVRDSSRPAKLFLLLDRIFASNLTLFVAILALNAAAQSYGGFVHDTRLYAIQTLNRIDPSLYGNDLYLRYGSQDKYSAFSLIAAPVVRSIGLSAGFFALYLVGNGLFYLGLMRLVLALVGDRRVAGWSLLFVAVASVPFGGLNIFHVNENFLTPRIWASGLALLGLEQTIRQHPARALVLLICGLLMHPLMAFPGLLVFLGWQLSQRLSPKQLLAAGVVASVLASIVLLVEPLGVRIFGHLDESWKETIHYANICNFPLDWSAGDWLRIAIAFGVALVSCRSESLPPATRRFAAVLVAVAVLGLVGAVLAPWLPYALLLQGQPYRVLWLLQLLEIPLGFSLMKQGWERGDLFGRGGAVMLLSYFSFMVPEHAELLPPLVCLAAVALLLSQSEYRVGFVGIAALAIGLFAWSELEIVRIYWRESQGVMTTLEYVRTLPSKLNPLASLAVCVGLLLLLARFVRQSWLLNAGLALVAVGLQVAYWAIPQSSTNELPEDTQFVKRFLEEHPLGRQPVVYWPVGKINDVWFDLSAACYFERFQLAGNLFHRDTAMEGQRRALVVKRFEIDQVRHNRRFYFQPQLWSVRGLHQADLDEPQPTQADLFALLNEDVDFLVLRQGFEELYTATNGTWFIYDFAALRTQWKGQ